MGSLVALDDFHKGNGGLRHRDDPPLRDSYWYFADTTPQHRTAFDPKKTYPHSVFIHQGWIDGKMFFYTGDYGSSQEDAGAFRVALREWIEANVEGTVVFRPLNHHYYLILQAPTIGEQKRPVLEVDHGYYEFMFQDDRPTFHMKIRFPEQVRTSADKYHPNYVPGPGQDYAATRYDAQRITGAWF